MTTRPSLTAGARSSIRSGFRPPRWLREPLLHFAILGAVLFAADYLLTGRTADSRTIVIDAGVDAEARRVFKEARGHPPNEQELYALRRVWLDNEVLYREGLALKLDKGDAAIRERVIFKALSMVDAGLQRPPVDDETLRGWFAQNHARYDEPTRYDFEEAVLAGNASDGDVRAFVADLNAGTPGDSKAGLRVFTGRPQANLVQSYGAEFATALAKLEPGRWAALPGSGGVHAVRLKAITPSRAADFETLRGVVLQDWTDAVMSEQRSAAVAAMAKRYTVKTEAKSK